MKKEKKKTKKQQINNLQLSQYNLQTWAGPVFLRMRAWGSSLWHRSVPFRSGKYGGRGCMGSKVLILWSRIFAWIILLGTSLLCRMYNNLV